MTMKATGILSRALDNSNMDLFMRVADLLGEGQRTSAASLLASISPENKIDENYKQYYALYLDLTENEDPSSQALSELSELCGLCPELHGLIVLEARVLYQQVTGLPFEGSDCDGSQGRAALKEDTRRSGKKQKGESSLRVYPNPTTGKLILVSPEKDSEYEIAILNTEGRLVYGYRIRFKENHEVLDLDLPAGLYLLRIQNRESLQQQKLIIQK